MIAEAVKIIGQLAVGIGVGAVTKVFIKSITPSNLTKFGKVAVEIGAWFIGGVLTVQAGKKWNDDVDKVVEIGRKIKKIKEEQKKMESKPETEAE